MIDASGAAMRLHTYPKMAMIECDIKLDKKTMTVNAPGMEELSIPLDVVGGGCSEEEIDVITEVDGNEGCRREKKDTRN